jgi:hypothetical protein
MRSDCLPSDRAVDDAGMARSTIWSLMEFFENLGESGLGLMVV